MRNKRICIFLASLCMMIAAEGQGLIKYIDTRVGTAQSTTNSAGMFGKGSEEMGQTLPAVLVPNGTNFWTPQTQDTEQKCRAPYYYSDTRIQGFRASHWIVGGCTQDYGSFTIMPITWIGSESHKNGVNKTYLTPVERSSVYSHTDETATPSYYSTLLKEYGIKAEMTGLSHSAIFRFTYPDGNAPCIVINPNSDEGEGYIEILPEKKQIRGYNPAHRIYQGKGEPCGFAGWFIVQLPDNAVIESYGTYHVDTIFEGRTKQHDQILMGAYVKCRPGSGTSRTNDLCVKVATSFVDWEGCQKNLDAEIPHWDFERTRKECTDIWEKHLSRVEVEGEGKEMFYTSLYHTLFLPREFSDADGRYPSFGGGKTIETMADGRIYYDDYSMWDTYRALHPLYCLLWPEKVSDMMQSLVLKYEQGGWMPIFPCWNSYTAAMIGDHCNSVFADALEKGIKNFDIEKAYEGLRKNAFESPSTYEEYANGKGRRALQSYLKYGYIPLEDSVPEAYHKKEQVSRTMEYAYDDFALSQIAKYLNRKTDYDKLCQRAANYKKVINRKTGYAQGRYADGKFLDEANQVRFKDFITEGAPCHYTFYAPHDVIGLANAMRGKKQLILRLDSLFDENRYWHGNEPCHQIAYTYDYIGEEWKTQLLVRNIMSREYAFAPGGLSGNDDAGQMSAWYVFSAMGFYPFCPGKTDYALGSPLFKRVSIRLSNGNIFTIKADNNSNENIYIDKMKMNGSKHSIPFITHKHILDGGVLKLQMTDKHKKMKKNHTQKIHKSPAQKKYKEIAPLIPFVPNQKAAKQEAGSHGAGGDKQ